MLTSSIMGKQSRANRARLWSRQSPDGPLGQSGQLDLDAAAWAVTESGGLNMTERTVGQQHEQGDRR